MTRCIRAAAFAANDSATTAAIRPKLFRMALKRIENMLDSPTSESQKSAAAGLAQLQF
jgi:hypothetical protein